MSVRSRHARLPAFSTSTYGFALMIFLLVAVAAAYVCVASVARFAQTAQVVTLEGKAAGLKTALMRDLHDTWRELDSLSRALGPLAGDAMEARLASFAETSAAVRWAGFADLGRVVTFASDGSAGTHADGRPWFTEGVDGPFLRDGTTPVEVASLGAAPVDLPQRRIELALPVRDAAGEVRGVLAATVDLARVEARFQEIAAALDLDAALISRAGAEPVAARAAFAGSDVATLRAAAMGTAGSFVERWADGYHSAVVLTDLGYGDLPDLGWSLVVRMPANGLASLTGQLPDLLLAGAITLAAVLALSLLYVSIYVRPLSRLAESAGAVAAGADRYPYETRRSRELADICAALGLLQASVAKTGRGF